METLALSQGKIAVTDSPDNPYLPPAFAQRLREALSWKWSATTVDGEHWYAFRLYKKANGKWSTMYLHRYLLQDELQPGQQVDHKNLDGLNCTYENMRCCSRAENARNRRGWRKRKNLARYKGVVQHNDRWTAAIVLDGIKKWLGTFDSPERAALAYNQAAAVFHGPFARLNPIDAITM